MDRSVGTGKKTSQMVKTGVLFLLLAVYIVPFFLIVINALKPKKYIVRDPLGLVSPKGVTFENFINAFNKMNFLGSFGNSLFVTAISIFFIILFSSMTAYLFVRADWKINKVLFGLMAATMVIPFQAVMIPLMSIYGSVFHILDMRTTLIFMNIGFQMGLAVFVYHGFIKSGVPISLEEAAKLDGCNRLQTFFIIVFPLLKSTTATIVVLDTLAIWNDYLLPSLVLGKKELFTLPLSTFAFYGTYSVDYGGIMAALVLTTIPVIVLYVFLQKQIINGVVAGAVKS